MYDVEIIKYLNPAGNFSLSLRKDKNGIYVSCTNGGSYMNFDAKILSKLIESLTQAQKIINLM